MLLFSVWMSGPGIAETDSPIYRWYYMLFFVCWIIGFFLQTKERTRVAGVGLTLIPALYYFVLLIRAATL
ncbi:hypothetical protein [Alkalihalobacterium chitinilyticum]|uniref:Uncharacterized protein n=1 Tax=Alkalihalobacterium chitinilyticum TaxID=2980103 RepID=A0ABT5VCP8_9BACI|nr:hypothetical protein [Alkalihalobacterium chitinilyticum]MDE5413231.1 hypothetical protein [Alkalihalobacterium chitinilyticum]